MSPHVGWTAAVDTTSPVTLVRSPLRLDARPEPVEAWSWSRPISRGSSSLDNAFTSARSRCASPSWTTARPSAPPGLRGGSPPQPPSGAECYLGVAAITARPDSALQVGGDGPVVDSCVVMTRLPAERMLDRLIAEKRTSAADMERLLDVLIPFYASAARGPHVEREATLACPTANARENFTTLEATDHRLPQPVLQRPAPPSTASCASRRTCSTGGSRRDTCAKGTATCGRSTCVCWNRRWSSMASSFRSACAPPT